MAEKGKKGRKERPFPFSRELSSFTGEWASTHGKCWSSEGEDEKGKKFPASLKNSVRSFLSLGKTARQARCQVLAGRRRILGPGKRGDGLTFGKKGEADGLLNEKGSWT